MRQLDKSDNLNEYSNVTRVTFFLLSLLFAPAIFLVVIFPRFELRFIDAMAESIKHSEK